MAAKSKSYSSTFKELINRNVITISSFESVSEAAFLMRSEDIGALVVVDKDTKPIGIITDRDIVVSVIAERLNPGEITVEDMMTKDPVTVDENTDLFDIIRILHEHSVRRLPITSGGKLTGIVSIDDLIVVVATEVVNMAMTMSSKSKLI